MFGNFLPTLRPVLRSKNLFSQYVTRRQNMKKDAFYVNTNTYIQWVVTIFPGVSQTSIVARVQSAIEGELIEPELLASSHLHDRAISMQNELRVIATRQQSIFCEWFCHLINIWCFRNNCNFTIITQGLIKNIMSTKKFF